MSFQLLAMGGQMGSGKDTASDHLVKHHGFVKLAFADNLKQMCMSVFGLSHDDCYDEVAKFKPFDQELELTRLHIKNIIRWVEDINFIFPKELQINNAYALAGTKLKSPRHVLQYVGTEVLRQCIIDDFHAIVVKTKIEREGLEKVVISDCRFANERQKVKEWGGKVVLVTGRNTTQNADDKAKSHASENSLGDVSEYDHVIENTGTLEELYSKIDAIV